MPSIEILKTWTSWPPFHPGDDDGDGDGDGDGDDDDVGDCDDDGDGDPLACVPS